MNNQKLAELLSAATKIGWTDCIYHGLENDCHGKICRWRMALSVMEKGSISPEEILVAQALLAKHALNEYDLRDYETPLEAVFAFYCPRK